MVPGKSAAHRGGLGQAVVVTAETPALAVRTLSSTDGPAMLEIAQLCDIAETGEPDTDLEDVLEWINAPGGRSFGIPGAVGLDAYAWVHRRPGHVALDADVRIRPGADASSGPFLLGLIHRAAGEIDRTRPMHLFVHVDDDERLAWLRAVDGRPVRHFWRMVIDLVDEVPDAEVLPGTVIRSVADVEADLRTVADITHTAFEDHFGHERGESPSYEEFVSRTHQASGFDIGLWWLALVDGEPAAALVGRQFDNAGFVSTLGTLSRFRGRGLGRALLRTAFREFRLRGLPRATLGVDASNPTGAVRLYESVGMRAEHSWAVIEVPSLS